MEYLDIVDENDSIVGKGSRKSVHNNYQIHRGVHIFIINNKGEILIQQRSLIKDDRPGFYDASVGAQMLSGENYKQTARRELAEELGIINIPLKEICKYKSFSNRQREIRTLFIAYYDGPFKIDKKEVESVKFQTIQQIKELIKKKGINFTDGFKISFSHYLNYLKDKK